MTTGVDAVTALWQPSEIRISLAEMTTFRELVCRRTGLRLQTTSELQAWSIAHPDIFWAIWSEQSLHFSSPPEEIRSSDPMPGTRWFRGAKLNYAEHLLRGNGNRLAIIEANQAGSRTELSLFELRSLVARCAAGLRRLGIEPGDHVAACTGNSIEAVVVLLACSTLGAVFTSASPGVGAAFTVDRFAQVKPKVLFASEAYFKHHRGIETTRPVILQIVAGLSHLRQVVTIPLRGTPQEESDLRPKVGIKWDEFLGNDDPALTFVQLPFDHPLYVLYSSGTTGLPKCFIHGAGGTLLNHTKEQRLHCDIRPGDRILYYTSCGWMMWNWLVSALASEATIVLYEGGLVYPTRQAFWNLVDDLGLTHLGLSAGYIHSCLKKDLRPRDQRPFKHLRSVMSTGSPLAPQGFAWIYEAVKADVHLASISGGTDIVGCFMLGDPTSPVYAGEIQMPGLGVHVDCFDDAGNSVRGAPGELVCRNPIPSMPRALGNDNAEQSAYRKQYFSVYPGVWRHGDRIEITPRGGIVVHGRSDATLNPGGVRIGTAEIYRPVLSLGEVSEALAVAKRSHFDEAIWLFVVLEQGLVLDAALKTKIESVIRKNTTLRHVPERIFQVSELPYTRNGKVMELAVSQRVNGLPVSNLSAVANPSSLDELSAVISPTPSKDVTGRKHTSGLTRGNDEPLAIIGMGCRFPGANGLDAFWEMLRGGFDAISEMPPERFDMKRVFDPRPGKRGKIYTKMGGFFAQKIDAFDAAFFGILPRNAAAMDPQSRILLEVVWEALEDAGQLQERLAGSRTAVIVGATNDDYQNLLSRAPASYDVYAWANSRISSIAGRISYALDLMGPSLVVDTACSSGLVALHCASQSLRRGECDLAIVGGVNVVLLPEYSMGYTSAKMFASDGRCKAFDARADGTIRSDGAGAVVLKPLSVALSDGDPIYAIVRGSAVGHDGRVGAAYMTPSQRGQEDVIRAACADACVAPGSIQYVEAHGTGTHAGDPVEVLALASVLGEGRPPEAPLKIGSVKTNIGHTEAAAGLAGVIKTALSLKQGLIPPSLHFKEPNPRIPWDSIRVEVQSSLGDWPTAGANPRRAGVSAFGVSKTNAHVVLEEAPSVGTDNATTSSNEPCILPLSARTSPALSALVGRYTHWLNRGGEESLEDICSTAGSRRAHRDVRVAVVAQSREELRMRLEAFSRGELVAGVSSGSGTAAKPKVVFLFPGQGSQWLGMGRALMRSEPVFRDALERCEEAFAKTGVVDWSLREQLNAPEAASRLNDIGVIQPTLFAMSVGLAALWRSWGVEPDGIVGHSMGEVAAAHVAGALSLEDASRVICLRSHLMREVRGKGAMASVELSLSDAQQRVEHLDGRVSVAASNGPFSTVLAGDSNEIQTLLETLQKEQVFGRLVKVDVASHSREMEPLRERLLHELRNLNPSPPASSFWSTVIPTTEWRKRAPLVLDATYWWQNLRQPVRFHQVTQSLLKHQFTVFIEMSPHPILAMPLTQTARHEGHTAAVLPSLRRDEPERATMLESLGVVYTAGVDVSWGKVSPRGKAVRIPNTPWTHQSFWIDTSVQSTPGHHEAGGAHPLLRRHLQSADGSGADYFEFVLSRDALTYLEDHQVGGAVVVPGVASLEMVLAALAHLGEEQIQTLLDVEFHQAIFLPKGEERLLQLVISGPLESVRLFEIHGRPKSSSPDAWLLHVSGKVSLTSSLGPSAVVKVPEVGDRCPETISPGSLYEKWSKGGIHYGPAFRGIIQFRKNDTEALAEVALASELEQDLSSYRFHPALLDACLHPTLGVSDDFKAQVPRRIARFTVYGRPSRRVWTHWESTSQSVSVVNDDGALVASFSGVRLQALEALASLEEGGKEEFGRPSDWMHEIIWDKKPFSSLAATADEKTDDGPWIILADRGGLGARLAEDLMRKLGARSILLYPDHRQTSEGGEPAQDAEGVLWIRPGNDQDLGYVFDQLSAPPSGVIHLWGLDASLTEGAGLTVSALEKSHRLGALSLLVMTRHLHGLNQNVPLWIVTRGAQLAEVEGPAVSPSQASLWGLGRSLFEEHPGLAGGMIDLAVHLSPNEACASLVEEITTRDGETQIARGTERRVARLEQVRRSAKSTVKLRPDASYLITGGLGGIGLAVANWLAKTAGARRLILMGRSQLPPRRDWSTLPQNSPTAARVAAILELEKLGVSVHLPSVDVGDEAALSDFLDGFRKEGWPPIRGVFHAAGVLTNAFLMETTPEQYLAVQRPKAHGAWLLHQLLEKEPLDYFVLFSSGSSLLSLARLGAYAAANAFLDGLAALRRSQGKVATVINWGVWSEVGMAAEIQERGEGKGAIKGMGTIPTQEGLAILGALMNHPASQTAILPVKWRAWAQRYPLHAKVPFFSRVVASSGVQDQPPEDAAVGSNKISVLEAILAVPSDEQTRRVEEYLAKWVAAVVRISPAKIDINRSVMQMGLDSLMAGELKAKILQELGVTVHLVRFLEGPSVVELAKTIHAELVAKPEEGAEPKALKPKPETQVSGTAALLENPEALLQKLDGLSGEEVSALLEEIERQNGPQ